MELKTFDTILNQMCDDFDAIISPRKITRADSNILYLIFKAMSKGYEIINNVVVALSNKFNPAYCDDADLLSVAELVGTNKIPANASGLKITATNNGGQPVTLLAGEYHYKLNDTITFIFTLLEDVTIQAELSSVFLAMSNELGSFPVTTQNLITVTSDRVIPNDVSFACTDNVALLGRAEETNTEFRERIMTQVDRQDVFKELEAKINAMPNVFDCRLKFNATLETISYEGYNIEPYHLIIFVSGNINNSIAKTVAQNSIYPTTQTPDSIEVHYTSNVFFDDKYSVYINPFKKKEFSVEVVYKIDEEFMDDYNARLKMRTALFNNFTGEIHKDYIKEDDVYKVLSSLLMEAVDILAVNLRVNGADVDYVSVPASEIPEIIDVTFNKV